MFIDMPDGHLVFLCGGNAGAGTDIDLGRLVKTYLYGDPKRVTEREIALGVAIVRRLVSQLSD